MEWKLWFLAVECRFFKDLSNYEEEKEAKEMTGKIMEGIDIFEPKIKNIRDLIIDTIQHDYDKLIGDLNMKKRIWNRQNKKDRNKTRETKIIKTKSWRN